MRIRKFDKDGVEIKTKPNKFDDLDKSSLVQLVLEQESELERLRPKPAKFKLGQILVYDTGKKPYRHPYWSGQPISLFVVLSLEQRDGSWHYGFSRNAAMPSGFTTWPEKFCRQLTEAEVQGTDAPAATATEASTAPITAATIGNILAEAGAHPISYDEETL